MTSNPKPQTHEFLTGRIITTAGTQPRAQLHEPTVAQYTQDLKDAGGDWPFPPVVLFHDGDLHYLADGFHRLQAAKNLNRKTILATINQGTARDAILHAAGANAHHGLRRTDDDKRRAVQRLLKDNEWSKWSDREIARICHVSPTFVGNLRRTLQETLNNEALTVHVDSEGSDERVFAPVRTYTDRHGNKTQMDTTNIGRKPVMPDEMRPHVETYIKGYTDNHGRRFPDLDNPSHTNSRFWQDITATFKAFKIPYAEAGLKFVIKQLHAQTQSATATQETAEPTEPDLLNQCVTDYRAWLKSQPGPKQPYLDQMLRYVSEWDPGQKYKMDTLNQARATIEAELQTNPTGPDANYAPIRQLQTLIHSWLIYATGGRDRKEHYAWMLMLKNQGNRGEYFTDLRGWMESRVTHRKNDLWQACQNHTEELRQQVERTIPTPSYAADIESRLHDALHSFTNAADRWQNRRETGLNDADLLHAISDEFGTGGSSGPDRIRIAIKGGRDPVFHYDPSGPRSTIYKGAHLRDEVRKLLQIPYPQQTAEQPIGSSAPETDGAAPPAPSAPQITSRIIETNYTAGPLAAKIVAAQSDPEDPRLITLRSILHQLEGIIVATRSENESNIIEEVTQAAIHIGAAIDFIRWNS